MKIIAAIDFSDITERVLNVTELMAETMSAEVRLIHVAEPNPDHIAYDYDPAAMFAVDPSEIRDNIAKRFHQEHQDLQQYAANLRAKGIACKALMVQGPTVDMLISGVDKLGADFIIAGSHGKGVISQVLLGSSSEALVRRSPVPVMLVPAAAEG